MEKQAIVEPGGAGCLGRDSFTLFRMFILFLIMHMSVCRYKHGCTKDARGVGHPQL